jgi:hypothetical protein
MNPGLATLGDTPAGETLAAAAASADPGAEAAKTAAAALAAPVQIWACGDNGHTHLVKTEALKCIEKRAAAGENGGTQWEPKPGSDGPASATKPAENITENITETAAVAETAEKLASVAETLEQPLVVIEPPLISEKGEAAAGPPDAAGEAEADAGTEEVAEADPPAEKAAQEASDVAQALGKAIDLVERARTALSTEGNYINWLTFTDNAKSVVEDVMRIRHHPLVPNDIPVYGYIYDVKSGKLQPSVRMKLPRL